MSEHELWNELGNLYFMSGAYNQAIHAYERSIQADTGFGRPYSNLALTYVQQGKYDEAIELYRRSIELLADSKEKAISWNRLGTVYRHLKDYSRAVIAFQEADELDPHSVDEFPVVAEVRQAPGPMPSSVLDEPVQGEPAEEAEALLPGAEPDAMLPQAELSQAEPEGPVVEPEFPEVEWEATGSTEASGDEDQGPKLEWWDVDEVRMQSATQREPVAALSPDDPNTSWTPADASQFQQDLSQMPETGSLTTWGDGDFDDDFELYPSLGSEPGQDLPDPDGEKMATWIPIPEEAPMNFDELWMPPFVDEEEPEVDFEEEWPAEWNEAPSYHIVSSSDFGPGMPAVDAVSEAMEYMERSEPLPARQAAAQQVYNQMDVDVAVEERPVQSIAPAASLALEIPQAPTVVEPEPIRQAAEIVTPEPEPAPAASLNALPPSLPDAERDDEEMREIEMGIAKFRRVVQINPRNAHAWDALGTLFKSAGLYKDAILAYQQAISNDSSKSLYYHHLGLVYACEGRDEDAISAFQRVIEIDPEYSLAHATLGGYYRKLGLEELAQKHIGKAMKNIFDSENEYNKACLQAICGNADQAIELLGVALKNKQTYVDWILRDPDLDFIRQDPRFKQLISEYTR